MTTPQPQPEPRVSDEDRDEAVDLLGEMINRQLHRLNLQTGSLIAWDIAREVLPALISHGWGPRPTLDGRDLEEFLTKAMTHSTIVGGVRTASSAMRGYLRKHGIEVTDHG